MGLMDGSGPLIDTMKMPMLPSGSAGSGYTGEVKTLPGPAPMTGAPGPGDATGTIYQRGQIESPWTAPQTNPYLAQYGQDVASLFPSAMAAQSKQNTLQGMANAFGSGGQAPVNQGGQSSYPAYPNAFGLGDSSQFTQQPPASPQPTQQPQLSQSPMVGSSMGFNPWSMTGEANSFI